VQEALASCDQYHLDPDRDHIAIRRLLAQYTGTSAERIILGNGLDGLIDVLCWLFLDPGDAVLIPTPTIGTYAARARVFGAQIQAIPRRPDFSLDIEAMDAALTVATKLVFVASPNNPTGNLCRERDIVRLLQRNVIVVVDEAYFEFSGRTVAHLTREFDNLVVLRSFSAWAGLAGLRVGYGLVPRWIAEAAPSVRPDTGLNIAADLAVQAIFEEMPYLRTTIRRLRLERLRMFRALRKLNFVRPLESKANFLLVQVLHGTGADLADWLEADGIFVRQFTTPELRDYVRISVGTSADTDRLVRRMTALAQKYARDISDQ
jgi:histidinol-phosphate aminotransferase